MKAFEDLTDDEKYALTDEQVDFYRDYSCAEAGAPLDLPAPQPPTKPDVVADVTLYMVGGIGFQSMEDASRVCALVNTMPRFKSEYRHGRGFRQIAKLTVDAEAVTPQTLFSEALAAKQAEAIDAYEAEKERFEKERVEHSKAASARQNACRWIDDELREARARVYERKSIEADFARYLELAGGDRPIAARFLRNRHGAKAEAAMPALYIEAALPALELAPEPVAVGDDVAF